MPSQLLQLSHTNIGMFLVFQTLVFSAIEKIFILWTEQKKKKVLFRINLAGFIYVLYKEVKKGHKLNYFSSSCGSPFKIMAEGTYLKKRDGEGKDAMSLMVINGGLVN